MRTKEEMFKDIRNWEMDAGESFLDYFDGSFNTVNFMFWLLGKGYITEEQFHFWEDYDGFFSGDDIVFGQEEFSVVKEPRWEYNNRAEYDAEYNKAHMILAEFLSSSVTYQRRVEKFLKENC